jgi:hypothetical protein
MVSFVSFVSFVSILSTQAVPTVKLYAISDQLQRPGETPKTDGYISQTTLPSEAQHVAYPVLAMHRQRACSVMVYFVRR